MKNLSISLFITSGFAAKQERGYLVSIELSFRGAKETVKTKSIQILAKDIYQTIQIC